MMAILYRIKRKVNKIYSKQKKKNDVRRARREELRFLEKRSQFTQTEWREDISKAYFDYTGREMNWDKPERFTEKITWRKLNDCNPVYSRLADKYAVREWVAKKIGEEYLIPLLRVWDKAEDIDFDSLPQQFVLKTNNASGTNIIVKDKDNLNRKETIDQLKYWLKCPFWAKNGEAHYRSIKPRIIAEQFMLAEGMSDLPDYKFFCFDGKVHCCETISNAVFNRHNGKKGWYTRDFEMMSVHDGNFMPLSITEPKPANYDEMVRIAEKLSEGMSHVRVDLYNINGKLYFGEMTFTSANGLYVFEPDEWDYTLGAFWDITGKQVDPTLVN